MDQERIDTLQACFDEYLRAQQALDDAGEPGKGIRLTLRILKLIRERDYWVKLAQKNKANK